ncbi:hypothetical protein ES705_39842 [subsurface metagenome]
MRIISFAWTTPAVMALRKTCTRRDWADRYALSWHAGDYAAAYNQLPRVGGKQFGIVRLTKRPYKELTSKMPADDYENEGFKWMAEQNLLIQGKTPLDFCHAWINAGEELWVVRFEIITVTSTTLNYPLWPSLWPDVFTRELNKKER